MKPIIRIILLVLAIAAAAWVGWLLFRGASDDNGGAESGGSFVERIIPGGGGDENRSTQAGTTEAYRKEFGKDDMLTITAEGQRVIVPNFYKDAEFINELGDATIRRTNTYMISYIPEPPTFFLTIQDENVSETLTAVEAAFLEILKIPRNQACLLTVIIAVEPEFDSEGRYVNPRGLSFCPPRS